MLIRITGAGEAMLVDPEDFRRFSIRFDAGARGSEPAEAALARLARPDGEAAWVCPEALRRLSPCGEDVEWRQGVARMVAFAETRGWVDQAGRVRAHIETSA
ncbi:hypothetical protein [Falsiroseomonas stagni]|uniref:Uncharacterized protein n=1 Tax=Falsiroseomonas stagni DSM 19981 TaxID=1123062 RepID=A0A1I3XS89_9PROT|nr:hypothetical protein [Falsiroseomonas stagni]SFK22392.1 hypothetical protein SAMN02745775_101604 [Falsiroseomonas stagni DSM 19981]